MKKTYLFTALGEDRPGLTAALLTILYRHGANVEESYTKVIAGQFLLAVAASFPNTLNLQSLKTDLASLKEKDFPVAVKEIILSSTEPTTPMSPYMIIVLGADHPGIMYRVTELLARHQINITTTESRVIGAKEKPAYAMVLEVEVPSTTSPKLLSKELETIARELSVEIELKPIEVMTL